jgi:hypothetical protein
MAHLHEDIGWCFNCHHRASLSRRGARQGRRVSTGQNTPGLRLKIGMLIDRVREPWRCDRCGSTRVTRNEASSRGAREYDTSDY